MPDLENMSRKELKALKIRLRQVKPVQRKGYKQEISEQQRLQPERELRIAEGRICTHAVKWKKVRKAVDVQEATADQGACAPWTRGNNCPRVGKFQHSSRYQPAGGTAEPLPDLENMSRKELKALKIRLRQVKPVQRRGYKQQISEQLRLQLERELRVRGFDGNEKEIDLLLRGGSIPSGSGLRIFYRNQRLQEDDKWRQWY